MRDAKGFRQIHPEELASANGHNLIAIAMSKFLEELAGFCDMYGQLQLYEGIFANIGSINTRAAYKPPIQPVCATHKPHS